MNDKTTGKPYSLGLMVGRFQMLHAGHTDMIRTAVSLCDEVGIFVGSAQESGTEKNPFSYELRKELLERVFPEGITVKPLPDIGVGNNSRWGDYVLERAKAEFGRLPEIVISGKEARRGTWYDGADGESIAELFVPKRVRISATEMRQYLLNDDRASWEQLAEPEIRELYEELRRAVCLAQTNTETASI